MQYRPVLPGGLCTGQQAARSTCSRRTIPSAAVDTAACSLCISHDSSKGAECGLSNSDVDELEDDDVELDVVDDARRTFRSHCCTVFTGTSGCVLSPATHIRIQRHMVRVGLNALPCCTTRAECALYDSSVMTCMMCDEQFMEGVQAVCPAEPQSAPFRGARVGLVRVVDQKKASAASLRHLA